jgi:hypothetical protein
MQPSSWLDVCGNCCSRHWICIFFVFSCFHAFLFPFFGMMSLSGPSASKEAFYLLVLSCQAAAGIVVEKLFSCLEGRGRYEKPISRSSPDPLQVGCSQAMFQTHWHMASALERTCANVISPTLLDLSGVFNLCMSWLPEGLVWLATLVMSCPPCIAMFIMYVLRCIAMRTVFSVFCCGYGGQETDGVRWCHQWAGKVRWRTSLNVFAAPLKAPLLWRTHTLCSVCCKAISLSSNAYFLGSLKHSKGSAAM